MGEGEVVARVAPGSQSPPRFRFVRRAPGSVWRPALAGAFDEEGALVPHGLAVVHREGGLLLVSPSRLSASRVEWRFSAGVARYRRFAQLRERAAWEVTAWALREVAVESEGNAHRVLLRTFEGDARVAALATRAEAERLATLVTRALGAETLP